MPRQSLATGFASFLLVLLFACVSSFLFIRNTDAIESLQFSLRDIVGDQLQLENVTSQLGFTSSGKLQLTLAADSAALSGVSGKLSLLSINCADFQPMPALSCNGGTLKLRTPTQQTVQLAMVIAYQSDEGRLRIGLGELKGYWQALTIKWQFGDEQRIQVNGQGITYDAYKFINQFVVLPELVLTSGTADIDVGLSLASGELRSIELAGKFKGISISNLETTQAMEAVSGSLDLQARQRQGAWRGNVSADVASGFIYTDPVGINASTHPLRFSSEFNWQPTGEVSLSDLHWRQPGVAELTTSVRFSFQEQFQLRALKVQAQSLLLGTVYPAYIQPWLYEFDIPALDLKGSLSGEVEWTPEATRLNARLNNIAVQEADGQFGIQGLKGSLNWSDEDARQHSEISWNQANFYQLPFGASRITFSSLRNEFQLAEPVSIPFFDGAIEIEEGFMRDPGDEGMAWSFDAYLQPVSMLQLTEALGWQTFGGKLSGMIPELRYQDRQLQLDGTLLVSAFDGSITVNNLLVDEPFGLVPRLQGDIVLDNLDLEAVTGTFSFGKIQGRLDGYINDLDMLAWQPVKFDALLITPDDDRSRHRISQRAVDNLTRIGGGVGGALSRSFMRFFEDFSYDKLGLGCRLEQGVCQMRGAQPAAQGYYIVKGGLMPPRIDIVGYADQVDWRQLVNQLIEVTRSGEVTVD